MATYVVGDPHGCHRTFMHLLDRIAFGQADRLVAVGDLVNRGPESAAVVAWMMDNAGQAESLLGNHDIYMLLVHAGVARPHHSDTTGSLLARPDAEDMCAWLRRRPFAVQAGGCLVVHAGVPPGWDMRTALQCAREAESAFRGAECGDLFGNLLGNEPALWDDALGGHDRVRHIVNALTRMRMCDAASGALDFAHKGPPETAGSHLRPWYEFSQDFGGNTVVCGHWASLGARDLGHVICVDSGCAWGRELTCVRLEDRELISVPNMERGASAR